MRARIVLIASAALAAVLWMPASGQPLWERGYDRPSVSLEVMKPAFENGENIAWSTSVTVLSARLPIGRHVRAVAEGSFAHYGYTGMEFPASANRLGNPALGVEVDAPISGTFVRLTARVPIVREVNAACEAALFTDFDRYEAFLADWFVVNAAAGFRREFPYGAISVRAGPSAFLYFGDENEDHELVLDYAAQGWLTSSSPFELGAGLTGRAILTDDHFLAEARALHQLVVTVAWAGARMRPVAYVRVPLTDDLGDTVKHTFGLVLTVAIR